MAIVNRSDTIVAQATPPGRGGVAIVRISGALAPEIALHLTKHTLQPRVASYLAFMDRDDQVLDQGIALLFPAPHSFTGETVLELHCHGGPVVVDLLVREAVHRGARIAGPGEFSERAFLNDKIDLIQAEAIADLIDSASEQAARGAMRSLQGTFSRQVKTLLEALIQVRMHVESAIDFPEEEIDFLADKQLLGRLDNLWQQILELTAKASEGAALREGIHVVIAGPPNAGKSSLLNALAEKESAIVTEIPGTTRDLLRELIQIDGIPLHIIDTAGLRDSPDQIEQEGIRRALQELERADRILLLTDDPNAVRLSPAELWPAAASSLPAGSNTTIVQNKIDLHDQQPALLEPTPESPCAMVRLSAKTGQGIDLLRQHLKRSAGITHTVEGSFIARRRHLDALRRAEHLVATGITQLTTTGAGELLAEDLRHAQLCLGEITGEFSSDDLLGRIFSEFCIGK